MNVSEKHRYILEKAEELFAAKGYTATTIRDIARAAKINLAMVSYYFGSKDKLVETLFRERIQAMQLKIGSIIQNENLDPMQKVEILIDEYISKVFGKQSFYKIMLCEQAQKKNKVAVKFIREIKFSYAQLLQGLVKDGQQKKIFRKNIDIILLMHIMSGTVTQILLNKDLYKDFNEIKKMPDAEFDRLLQNRLSTQLKQLFKHILLYEP